MTNSLRIFSVIIFLFVFNNTWASQYKFRVQCFSNGKEMKNFEGLVPQLTSFTLPSGGKVYFSGGYFELYSDAEERLKLVKSNGVVDAEIRVFKSNRYLSEVLNKKYLPIARELSLNNEDYIRAKQKERLALNKFKESEQQIEESSKSKKVENIAETAVVDIKPITIDKSIEEEIIKELEEEKEETKSFDEAPVFKILLVKQPESNSTPEVISEFTEMVYKVTRNKESYYTVGYYTSYKDASKELQSYVNKGFKKASVIGYYKGSVISHGLAVDILNSYF